MNMAFFCTLSSQCEMKMNEHSNKWMGMDGKRWSIRCPSRQLPFASDKCISFSVNIRFHSVFRWISYKKLTKYDDKNEKLHGMNIRKEYPVDRNRQSAVWWTKWKEEIAEIGDLGWTYPSSDLNVTLFLGAKINSVDILVTPVEI